MKFPIHFKATLKDGMCHMLQFDKSHHGSTLYFKISLNQSLSNLDIPNQLLLYLTSNDTWYGLILNEWPHISKLYLEPIVINVDTRTQFDIGYSVREVIFMPNRNQGDINDYEDCFMNLFLNSSCTLCFPILFNFVHPIKNLPPCTTSKELWCELEQLWSTKRKDFMSCLVPKKALLYEPKLNEGKRVSTQNKTLHFALFGTTFLKQIQEEVYVITPTSFVGSIGGSLGLFFGFSFLTCCLSLAKKISVRLRFQ